MFSLPRLKSTPKGNTKMTSRTLLREPSPTPLKLLKISLQKEMRQAV